MKKLKKLKGFTLAELIVVITVLAVLATVGFLALSGYSQDAKESAVKTNVRSVYSAIVSESAMSGNSPRYYVVHDSNWALSWAVVAFAEGQTTLTGGDWNQTGTNYSAGNPDFAKLRMNSAKFKVSGRSGAFEKIAFDGTDNAAAATADSALPIVWAMDLTETSANGKIRTRWYVQVAGVPNSGNVSVTGNFPVGLSGSVSGLVRNPSSGSLTGALVDAGGAVTVTKIAVWMGTGSSANPWKKWDGTVLASCNDYRTSISTAPHGGTWSTTTGSGQDGAYSIDPDGAGSAVAPYVTYCDMTLKGGGWTLLVSPQLSGATYNRSGNFYNGTAGTNTNFVQAPGVTINSGDLEKTIKNLGFRYVRMKNSSDGTADIVYESSNSTSTFAQKKAASTSWLPAGVSCRNAMGLTSAPGPSQSYYDVDALYWNQANAGTYTYTEGLLVCPYYVAYGDLVYVGMWTRSTATNGSYPSVGGDQIDFASGNATHRQGWSWVDIYVK